MNQIKVLDCTLRDGGYYNNWDFSVELVEKYLVAMSAISVDIVELGMRTLKNSGFKGALAFTRDEYLETLNIPSDLTIGVMINGSELYKTNIEEILENLFPKNANESKVSFVRVACHFYEFVDVLPSAKWLKERGYQVGFNIMQASNRTQQEFELFADEAGKYPLDVLYFADSLGNLEPKNIQNIIRWIQNGWSGDIGIHAHDNMHKAVQNTLTAAQNGVNWLDATITGMGRGSGNTQTEYLITELCEERAGSCNIVPLMELIEEIFLPMQQKYGWGTNIYYYLAGKYGIHPTFIQNMLNDTRYRSEDILAVINYLKNEGGENFSYDLLNTARDFYTQKATGKWNPKSFISNQEVLILGAGPQGHIHAKAIERYIQKKHPLVIGLNTESPINAQKIDLRVASHPIRLLADCSRYSDFSQPLALPFSMLPEDISSKLKNNHIFDYGIKIQANTFEFNENNCVIPSPLVIAYALAIVTRGGASRIVLAGFDGYGADDPRTKEMQELIALYRSHKDAKSLISVTPTTYNIQTQSIYAI